jgi:chloride channel protein, CIC family
VRPRPPANAESRTANLVEISILAIAIGVVTGLAGVLFRACVAVIHNAFFLGEFSTYYDPNVHTPASWLGPLVIWSPAVGGLAVIFLSRLPPADRRGQGVSDIIDAIYYREGRVRSLQAVVKSAAAGIQSGSGGAVGREAAIVQIGAAIASRLARLVNLAQWQRMTLVAAGGAAGLAAAFNAPLGSIVFAVELMMPEISPRTLLPVTMAAGAGTFVARIFYGLQPTFLVQTITAPELRISGVIDLAPFVVFGIILGVVSWLMIRVLSWTEKLLNKVTTNPYLKHASAMMLVGLMIYGMKLVTGDYQIQGPSYAALQDILRGDQTALWFFALLFVAKFAATTLTLASGGSGGVFSASLIIGAALGGIVGDLTQMLMPQSNINLPDYAIVGMAGMLGGTTGAAMTAIVMVFELTRDYNVIVPLIMAVTLAIAVRRAVLPQSIYTLKLADKGHEVPDSLQANMYRIRLAERAMSTDIERRPADATIDETLASIVETGRPLYVMIASGNRLSGYVRLDPGFKLWRPNDPGLTLGDLARNDFVLVRPQDTVFNVIGRLARRGARLAIVVGGSNRIPRIGDVRGVIALETMGAAVIENAAPFAPQLTRNPYPLLYRRRVAWPFSFWRGRRKTSV